MKILFSSQALVIYDSEGHTVMTMEDITEDTFSVEDYESGRECGYDP
jgi:hypothetical protein